MYIKWQCSLFRIFVDENRILVWGNLKKYRSWEIQIDFRKRLGKVFHLDSCHFKRLFGGVVYILEGSIFNLIYFHFVINDSRVWDDFTDSPITIEEAFLLDEQPPRQGKPKYKPRLQGKEKWYFTSQFLKLYNLDYLNDPWGITIDLAWFPFLLFTTLQLGVHPRHKFCLGLDLELGESWNISIEICLFGLFAEFTVGANTLDRKANLKYVDDFNTLVARGANVGLENLIKQQIIRHNSAYLWEILYNSNTNIYEYPELFDKYLVHAAFYDTYRKEVFNLLFEKAKYFNSVKDIEYEKSFEPEALEKIKTLPRLLKTNLDSKTPMISYRKNAYKQGLHFSRSNDMFETYLKLLGCILYKLLIQWHDKYINNIEFILNITRKYYIFAQVINSDKTFSRLKISKDGFSPVIIEFGFLKYYYQIMLTQYHFNCMGLDWNYEKNRPYTTEELIKINYLNKNLTHK